MPGHGTVELATLEDMAREIEALRTRTQFLEDKVPQNSYKRKVDEGHHHYQSAEGFDDDVSLGFGYQFNFRHGISAARDSSPTNRRFDIDAAGAICYDFTVDPGYTGTAGQSTPTTSGGTTRLYSSLQAAIDQAEADATTRTIQLCGNVTENVTWDPGSGNGYSGSLIIHGVVPGGIVTPTSRLTGTFTHGGRQTASNFLELRDFGITGTFTAQQDIGERVRAQRMEFADVELRQNDYFFEHCTMDDLVLRNDPFELRFEDCEAANIDGDAAGVSVTNFQWRGGKITGSITIREADNVLFDTDFRGAGATGYHIKIGFGLDGPFHTTIRGTMSALSGASAAKDYILLDEPSGDAFFDLNIDVICEKPTSTTNEVHYLRAVGPTVIRNALVKMNCGVDASGTKLEDMTGSHASVKGKFAQSVFLLSPCDAVIDLTGSTAGSNCVVSGDDSAGLSAAISTHIEDRDTDTYVHTEKTADVDQVEQAVAGTIRSLLKDSSPHLAITGDQDISSHLAVGGSASISANELLSVNEAINNAANSSTQYGGRITLTGTGSGTSRTLIGIEGAVATSLTSKPTLVRGLQYSAVVAATAGATEMNAMRLALATSGAASGTVDDAYLIKLATVHVAGTVVATNLFGIHIPDLTATGWTPTSSETAYGIQIDAFDGDTDPTRRPLWYGDAASGLWYLDEAGRNWFRETTAPTQVSNLVSIYAKDSGGVSKIYAIDDAGDESQLNHANLITMTLERPGSGENVTKTFFPEAVTVKRIQAVVVGSNSPSVTIEPKHSTDRSASGNDILSSPTAITNTTTGQSLTSFDDATIPASSWVWMTSTAKSGTVQEVAATMIFTPD